MGTDGNGHQAAGPLQLPQGPPWAAVDPAEVCNALAAQVAAQAQQIAMRDAYIAQLHAALAQLGAPQPTSDATS